MYDFSNPGILPHPFQLLVHTVETQLKWSVWGIKCVNKTERKTRQLLKYHVNCFTILSKTATSKADITSQRTLPLNQQRELWTCLAFFLPQYTGSVNRKKEKGSGSVHGGKKEEERSVTDIWYSKPSHAESCDLQAYKTTRTFIQLQQLTEPRIHWIFGILLVQFNLRCCVTSV